MRTFWDRLANIDRRVIYLLVALGVILPIVTRAAFKVTPLREVRQAYEEIEKLPPGSVVLFSIDYDAASMPELQPMLVAMLDHCFRKDLKVLMMGHWPLGLPLGQIALEQVARKYHKRYGVDYAFLGFRPGVAAVMINLGKDLRQVFNTDYRGTPVDSLPVLRNVHNYNDIAILVGLEAGATGDAWVQFAQARYNQKIILGATAVVAPDLYPYLQAGQIVGLIGGLRGAADYEQLVNIPGPAFLGMPAQTIIHILVVVLIILGNLGYFARRQGGR